MNERHRNTADFESSSNQRWKKTFRVFFAKVEIFGNQVQERKQLQRCKIIFIPVKRFWGRVTRSKESRVRRWNGKNPLLRFPAVHRSNKCRGCCDWNCSDLCCWPAPRSSRNTAVFTTPYRSTATPGFPMFRNAPGRYVSNRAVYAGSWCNRGPPTICSRSMFFEVSITIENNFRVRANAVRTVNTICKLILYKYYKLSTCHVSFNDIHSRTTVIIIYIHSLVRAK